MEHKPEFVGRRCIPSLKGDKIFVGRSFKPKWGTVLGESRDGRCYRVLWDGRKSPQTLHKDFVILEDPHHG